MSVVSQPRLFAPPAYPAPSPPVRKVRHGIQRGRPAAVRVCVLGSGSGGNCTVVHVGRRAILIDAGFGPRTVERRLSQAGLALDEVAALCVTHFDQDHFRPSWARALIERCIPVWLHRFHLPDLLRLRGGPELQNAGLALTFNRLPFEPLPGVAVSPIRLQHDRKGTTGYRFDLAASDDCLGGTIGYATDLGHAPPALIRHLAGVDLLCLEANYDPHMTLHSRRPVYVNRRNMSDGGHLSNEQAFDAVRLIASLSPPGNPRHILLMHRSQQCNHPTTVERMFERDAVLAKRVVLTEQRRRTRWFSLKPQPAMMRDQLAWAF